MNKASEAEQVKKNQSWALHNSRAVVQDEKLLKILQFSDILKPFIILELLKNEIR